MPKFELTTMVMIRDPSAGRVLVQNRVKNWQGLSFPGGHVEEGESFVDCAMREVHEETGLRVQDLKSCGVIHWLNNKTFDRYLVMLYRTSDFSGELLDRTDEGRNFWMDPEALKQQPSANDFGKYLPMFFEDKYCEAFGSWNNEEPYELVYK